jgi:hypothetical protein
MRNSRGTKDSIDYEANNPSVEIQAIKWYVPIVGDNVSCNARFYLEARHPTGRDCQNRTLYGLHLRQMCLDTVHSLRGIRLELHELPHGRVQLPTEHQQLGVFSRTGADPPSAS